MRFCHAFGLVLAAYATAQEPIPACLNQLAKPVYPPLAKQARVQGEATLKFSVDENGQPAGMAAEGHKLLIGAVSRTAEGVAFNRKRCAGKKFTVRYQFAIDDAVSPGTVFVPPSGFRVTIKSEPVKIQYSNYSLDEECLKPLMDKLAYQPLARQAMVQGEALIIFHLTAAGAIQESERSGHKLLTEGVVMQARDIRFDVRRCSTRIPVTVRFQLKDPESYDGKSTVVFEEPSLLVVFAHRPAPVIN